jgi:hypothetical protein
MNNEASQAEIRQPVAIESKDTPALPHNCLLHNVFSPDSGRSEPSANLESLKRMVAKTMQEAGAGVVLERGNLPAGNESVILPNVSITHESAHNTKGSSGNDAPFWQVENLPELREKVLDYVSSHYLSTGALVSGAFGLTKWGLDMMANNIANSAPPEYMYSLTRSVDLESVAQESMAGRGMAAGSLKAIGIVGGSLLAGYAADKVGASVFGYKQPEALSMKRLVLDGVVVPGVLLSELPARYKFALSGTAFAFARLSNYLDAPAAARTLKK